MIFFRKKVPYIDMKTGEMIQPGNSNCFVRSIGRPSIQIWIKLYMNQIHKNKNHIRAKLNKPVDKNRIFTKLERTFCIFKKKITRIFI